MSKEPKPSKGSRSRWALEAPGRVSLSEWAGVASEVGVGGRDRGRGNGENDKE